MKPHFQLANNFPILSLIFLSSTYFHCSPHTPVLQAARNTSYFHTYSTLSCLGCFHWPLPCASTPQVACSCVYMSYPVFKDQVECIVSKSLQLEVICLLWTLPPLSFSLFPPWYKVFLLLFCKLCVIPSRGKKPCVKRRETAWERIMLLNLQYTYRSSGNLAKTSFWFSRSGLRPEVHF